MLETDLHDVYGIDVESGVLRQRSWRWLQLRVLDLVARGPRLGQVFNPAGR